MDGHDDHNDDVHPSPRSVPSTYPYTLMDSDLMLRELSGQMLDNTNAVSPMTHLRGPITHCVPELPFTRYDLFPCLMTLS